METKKTSVELDDKKSSKGLGELYEEEYQRVVTGVTEDKVSQGGAPGSA